MKELVATSSSKSNNSSSEAAAATFVKYEDGRWWQLDDSFAREKIGGLFRDVLHIKYRSSNKSKVARKKARKENHSHCYAESSICGVGSNDSQHSQALSS
jgi:hypothetical protein